MSELQQEYLEGLKQKRDPSIPTDFAEGTHEVDTDNYALHPLQIEQIQALMKDVAEANAEDGPLNIVVSPSSNGELVITMHDKERDLTTSIDVSVRCVDVAFTVAQDWLQDAKEGFSEEKAKTAGFQRPTSMFGKELQDLEEPVFTKIYGVLTVTSPDWGETFETSYDMTEKLDNSLDVGLTNNCNHTLLGELEKKCAQNFERDITPEKILLSDLASKLRSIALEQSRKAAIESLLSQEHN